MDSMANQVVTGNAHIDRGEGTPISGPHWLETWASQTFTHLYSSGANAWATSQVPDCFPTRYTHVN